MKILEEKIKKEIGKLKVDTLVNSLEFSRWMAYASLENSPSSDIAFNWSLFMYKQLLERVQLKEDYPFDYKPEYFKKLAFSNMDQCIKNPMDTFTFSKRINKNFEYVINYETDPEFKKILENKRTQYNTQYYATKVKKGLAKTGKKE